MVLSTKATPFHAANEEGLRLTAMTLRKPTLTKAAAIQVNIAARRIIIKYIYDICMHGCMVAWSCALSPVLEAVDQLD